MDRFDEYRAYAAECQRMADATTKEDEDRALDRRPIRAPGGEAEAGTPQPRGPTQDRSLA